MQEEKEEKTTRTRLRINDKTKTTASTLYTNISLLWTSRCSSSGFRRKDKFHTQIFKETKKNEKHEMNKMKRDKSFHK